MHRYTDKRPNAANAQTIQLIRIEKDIGTQLPSNWEKKANLLELQMSNVIATRS